MSKTRNRLDLKTKIKLIYDFEVNGYKQSDLVTKYNSAKSTVSETLKKRKELKELADKKNVNKNKRQSYYPKIEEALILWMKNSRIANIPCNGLVIKAKAKEFAIKILKEKADEFKA